MKTSRKIMVAGPGLGVVGGAGTLALAGPGGFGAGFGPGKGGPVPRFQEMDVNKNGVVTRDEVAAYKRKRFVELDANRDGKVDASEIDQVIAKRLTRARAAFARVLKKGDAPAAELDAALRAMQGAGAGA